MKCLCKLDATEEGALVTEENEESEPENADMAEPQLPDHVPGKEKIRHSVKNASNQKSLHMHMYNSLI